VSSGPAISALKAFVGSDRIVFGTDFPYTPARVGASFTATLDADDSVTADDHTAISHGNAAALFARLAPRHDTAATERHSG
jgi:aminocarboxymuconate-semialdehyde decarboxylase